MSYETRDPATILYENRLVFLFGEINEETAARVVPMLLVMDGLGSDPIKLYINSPGGEVSAGLAIYDTMQIISAPVYTICVGRAFSMAAWLLAAGSRGNRLASENARIMIHQGRTIMGGTHRDLKVSMEEFSRTEALMTRILAVHCGKQESEVDGAIDRDRWMTAQEALEFGLIDRVVRNPGSAGRPGREGPITASIATDGHRPGFERGEG